MADDDDFASPNRKPRPPRQSEPGEPVVFSFHLRAKSYRVDCASTASRGSGKRKFCEGGVRERAHRFMRAHVIRQVESERFPLGAGDPSTLFWEE